MKSYVAHIIIKAQTPLRLGSGDIDFLQDAPVQRDFNSLPIILGTSIAGVLRKEFEKVDKNVANIFGEEIGSKVIVSNGLLLDENYKVCENLLLDYEKSDFLRLFDTLPIREHTAINNKGVSKDGSKYDEEVVFKGSKFKFSIELIDESEEIFNKILSILSNPSIRLGGGITRGFGKLSIEKISTATYDETTYDTYSSSLNFDKLIEIEKPIAQNSNLIEYVLELQADDTFIFGSGYGDDEADSTPVYEIEINEEYNNITKKKILIPASSLKGAIAHRTTYNYNVQNDIFIGDPDAIDSIPQLFGKAKSKDDKGCIGKVFISDCFIEKNKETKVFNHNAIDSYTGGTKDGALYSERVIESDDEKYIIQISVENSVEKEYIKAFEKTLDDIKDGLLPLGGMTTKGHGFFYGNWRIV